jgi:hypothetical protein
MGSILAPPSPFVLFEQRLTDLHLKISSILIGILIAGTTIAGQSGVFICGWKYHHWRGGSLKTA